MQINLPLACFLSIIRPPSIEIESAIFQLAPVDKMKCPFVRDKNDVGFRLYTRHNPTVYQNLAIDDDEALFASHINFHDPTVIVFHAFLEEPNFGSGIMLREAYVLRGDTNVIMVDAGRLEAGPWYFTAADNTWYIGRMAAMFIDYLVARGLNLSRTHLIGHSLGAHSAAVAGATITSGRVSRITGLDPALPLFNKVSLLQQLDPSDAEFVDVIHTDAGIFGMKRPVGHVDFYPNGGQSPQPGCELEVVIPQQLLLNKIFCSHWRSYQFYSESVLRPASFTASECRTWRDYKHGRCAAARTQYMGYAADRNSTGIYYLMTHDKSPYSIE
ncbi:pancreatic lipase-related protein 2-like [Epargyreus clarus]|uniref:pancreatic lipase-related protein 2-like n=1 Tax=Epargyreus clarus TaxID=520877 RepID=UPI003C2D0CBF